MKIRPIILASVTASALVACGESKFKSGVDKRSIAKKGAEANPTPPSNSGGEAVPEVPVEAPKPLPTYNYSLLVNNGQMVTGAVNVGAEPNVLNGLKQSLGAVDLQEWEVKVRPETAIAPVATPVESQFVDVTANSGLTRIVADFENKKSKAVGQASQIIYVDTEAPMVNIVRLSDSIDGQSSQIVWMATDNYSLDDNKTAIIGCKSQIAGFIPTNRKQIEDLPEGCIPIHSGSTLHAMASELREESQTIDGVLMMPRDIHYAIYAEDLVGLSAFSWINKGENGLLTLNANPTTITYTKDKNVSFSLKLLHVKYKESVQIDAAANAALRPNYELSFSSMPAANAPAKTIFKTSVPFVLGPSDGAYVATVEAAEKITGLKSNQQTVRYVLDTTPPKIDGIQLSIDKIVPSTASNVALKWTATDANPIVKQWLEIKLASSSAWVKVKDLTVADRATTFAWGNREVGNFEVRLGATDIAGNTGYGSYKYVRQTFNAAILTRSVNCYFCHMTVRGDVGGINFPSSIHQDSGRNFEIKGKLFATNTAPALLTKPGMVSGGVFNNYKNTDLKIFPKDNKFPVMTPAQLKAAVQGTLSNGSIAIDKVHVGNLVLDGSTNPIVLNGEVYIDGELIIKGKYKGVGTIYAKNIYIANDVLATKSPFPFSDDPKVAVEQAQDSVARGDDGLYLGALDSIVIGPVNNLLNEADDTRVVEVSPFETETGVDTTRILPAWRVLKDYTKLGTQAEYAPRVDGATANLNTHQKPDTAMYANEVSRVDAYLYSQKVVSWRSYQNLLLNGGFMSPEGGFVAAVPHHMWHRASEYKINPRNKLDAYRSEIRYDYRLRVGAGGFETLKTYFDQQ